MGTTNMFWQEEIFDLSAYVGQSIMVRFHFGSDGSVYKSGWYVDDVMIRSTDTDDYPPTISGTTRAGKHLRHRRTVHHHDPRDGCAVGRGVRCRSSTRSTTASPSPKCRWRTARRTLYSGAIPGQPSGTKIKFYVKAVDSSSAANETVDPAGAPAMLYSFGIMPSSPILVVVSGSTSGTSLAMFQQALATAGHDADYWNRTTQGWLTTDKLILYKYIFVDEPSGLTTDQMTGLAAYLAAGTQGAKKRLVLMGRDLGYNSTTRPWLEQNLRVNYVQDNPNYWQVTGYPGDPIGAGESFVIAGSYPDEWQRSTTYPGGEIVFQYTGTGTAKGPERAAGRVREGSEGMGRRRSACADQSRRGGGDQVQLDELPFRRLRLQPVLHPAARTPGGGHGPDDRVAVGAGHPPCAAPRHGGCRLIRTRWSRRSIRRPSIRRAFISCTTSAPVPSRSR